ncbi:MAG: ATP-dependent helicase RecG, partial [Solirubrobacterales bacterium]|nr:ATP-dependent helicase RecG [Solirubrobacterales bacterium]
GLSLAELNQAPVRWPCPSRLQVPLRISAKKMAAGMRSLGLETVGELLEHLPSDSREARTVGALRAGEQATVSVEVRAIGARSVRRRGMRPLVEAIVFDATGSMRATFFNQPWLVERYPPGTRLLLHGKADARGGFRVSHHAVGADGAIGGPGDGEAVAHYPAAEGVTSTQILTLVQGARNALGDVAETLSAATRVAEALPDRASALAAMHFPRDPRDAEAGRRRLAFEELLLTQLALLRRRARRRAGTGAPALCDEPSLSERWLSSGLPFAPTRDQRAAIATVREDLAHPQPMQRLLMGEVGSGKTVVALYAMLRAVEHGHQAALMAPTETLAEQHFATLQRLVGSEPVAVALLTGSTAARRREDVLGKLANGELSMVVGTHALIEPDVAFHSLAVAVIDEQHRFGVRQRAALADRESIHTPHTLHMTATPIPRTLALARYGDLDRSALRELPRGRQPIKTSLVSGEEARGRAYDELRSQLQAGRQAFVVCPLVEEAEEAGPLAGAADGAASPAAQRAATAELRRLRKGELAGYELALLHGAMRPREKQEAMAAFASGKADVLVATTVIEVGIDVPNATVMLIENAERFGISQLHQLRGRIGRGEHRGSCFLLAAPGQHGSARLSALVKHADGFKLAEIDLQLRKQGELIGTRQSGFAEFRIAQLPGDADLLERARAQAEAITAVDPHLQAPEHALLGWALERAFGFEALEPIAP